MLDALWKLALEQGGLFLVCVSLAAVVVYQHKEARACDKARLDDAKATIPVLEAANKAMAAITAEMASRTNMAGGMAEAIRQLVEAQKLITTRVDQIYEMSREDRVRDEEARRRDRA